VSRAGRAQRVGVSFLVDGSVSLKGPPELKENLTLRWAIGRVLVASCRRSFALQRSPAGTPWRPRAVPNVAGMLSDFERGASPVARRFQPAPALRDTGHMERSLSFRLEPGRVTPTVGAEYAALHLNGGVSSIAIAPGTKRAALRWLDERDQDDEIDKRLRGALKRDTLKVNVPSRPFLGADAQAQAEIKDLVKLAPFMKEDKKLSPIGPWQGAWAPVIKFRGAKK
jgi:phage gpG-like protein